MDYSLRALKLIARFSMPPNILGYCGDKKIEDILLDCIQKNKCEKVIDNLPGFKTLYPFLQTIAKVCDKNWLDYEVVEAYWLGNNLLKKFNNSHYEIYIREIEKLNLPNFYIHSMKKRVPKMFLPFHAFSVIHTERAPQEMIDNCLISIGRVDEKKVAKHWGRIVKTLTKREEINLSFWSEIVLANAGK